MLYEEVTYFLFLGLRVFNPIIPRITHDEAAPQLTEDAGTATKFEDDNNNMTSIETNTIFVAEKSTQTVMEKRMCYRCALVTQDAKLPQDASYDNITYATEKKGIKGDIGHTKFSPKGLQIDNLEVVSQELEAMKKSSSVSNVSISRCPSNYSMADNSGYKEIFKEIFLILHNANNA